MNLTAGVTADSSDSPVPTKSELVVSGSTVHFVWAENENYANTESDKCYRVLYRRSTDGGTTWEDARTLTSRCTAKNGEMYDWNGYSNMMQVAGNTVHVLVPYYDGEGRCSGTIGGKLLYSYFY